MEQSRVLEWYHILDRHFRFPAFMYPTKDFPKMLLRQTFTLHKKLLTSAHKSHQSSFPTAFHYYIVTQLSEQEGYCEITIFSWQETLMRYWHQWHEHWCEHTRGRIETGLYPCFCCRGFDGSVHPILIWIRQQRVALNLFLKLLNSPVSDSAFLLKNTDTNVRTQTKSNKIQKSHSEDYIYIHIQLY